MSFKNKIKVLASFWYSHFFSLKGSGGITYTDLRRQAPLLANKQLRFSTHEQNIWLLLPLKLGFGQPTKHSITKNHMGPIKVKVWWFLKETPASWWSIFQQNWLRILILRNLRSFLIAYSPSLKNFFFETWSKLIKNLIKNQHKNLRKFSSKN